MDDLRDTVQFSKVDCTLPKKMCDRFEVSGFPTLILFAGGMMYRYAGGRDQASLHSFATGGYTEQDGQVAKAFGRLT